MIKGENKNSGGIETTTTDLDEEISAVIHTFSTKGTIKMPEPDPELPIGNLEKATTLKAGANNHLIIWTLEVCIAAATAIFQLFILDEPSVELFLLPLFLMLWIFIYFMNRKINENEVGTIVISKSGIRCDKEDFGWQEVKEIFIAELPQQRRVIYNALIICLTDGRFKDYAINNNAFANLNHYIWLYRWQSNNIRK